ncbi:hypothetical protein DTO013E5_1564 [Penicillium roqueforti]|uniref:START-like domain n=1 Tax=Penicillium roqueforti (strain FM164) TaxID=1365484 RepID=W6QAW5_PENRF|nr:hypothetical protein CBS147354_6877 [Penicillium roqueforti]CDM33813.1 START-like domain [Penicillium roqueforti FM164]KAI2745452.1 hypothetical protein DTO012A1_2091 [Penicillium roqueforti]KAI2754281.1 hypothetical protein DTO013F2_2107 [Penicillium roqueforti]KAI2768984.1 hypothetical protein DTO012A8_5933 [Penicillium roqueforti]
MATLHDALQCLKPTSWDEVPQDPDELRDYLRAIFKNSRLIAESLPDPPISDNHDYPGLDDTPNSSDRRIVPSPARVEETDSEITDLQKEWGKPLKMGGPKDNPLDVTVWKLSANDGGGSWFGRRSVHEGMPFSRWRKKLSSEYDETLKVNRRKIERGHTPDKSIRGIGAEGKMDTIEVKDHDGSVLGHLVVYHVSAQFPKPTSPRDFVELIINSDSGLQIGGTKQPGRSWMMISKPCEHPGIPHKQGYTRGQYESVELIREIPKKHSSGSSSSSQGSKKNSDSASSNSQRPVGLPGQDGAGDEEHEEMNPVEWIMVSRSDPGGNIPRWMVDKGTPRSVGTDAAKFVNWALQDDKPPKRGEITGMEAADTLSGVKAKPGESVNEYDSDQEDDSDSDYESLDSDSDQSHHGLIASVTGLLNTGLERFAPQVLGYGAPTRVSGDLPAENEVSYIDADGMRHLRPEIAQQNKSALDAESSRSQEQDDVSLSSANSEKAATAVEDVTNNMSPEELIQMTKNGKLSSNEKELAKLAIRKRKVESKLEEVRAEIDKFQISSQPPSVSGTPVKGISEADGDTTGMRKRAATNRSSRPASTRTQQSQGQPQSEISNEDQPSPGRMATPDPSHLPKAATHYVHGESKLLKQLRKIEANQLKVASKIQARQQKDEERSEKSKSKNKSEVDTLKQEVHNLKKEVKQLRSERQKWVDLVSSLQAENTKLAAKSEVA